MALDRQHQAIAFVNGVVLISFTDPANGPQVALGRGNWRWTDLLGAGRR